METKEEYKTENKPIAPLYRVVVVITAEKFDALNPEAAPEFMAARTMRFISEDLWALRAIKAGPALRQTYENATEALCQKEWRALAPGLVEH